MPGTKSGGGWSWKKGKGDPEQLADADTALAIENTKFLFQRGYGDSAYVINKLSEDFKDMLEDYDVYVYSIMITSEGYWDDNDDEGNFYGGMFYDVNFTLAAGRDFKIATNAMLFGVR